MPEIRIGEKMSESTDMNGLLTMPNGELFHGEIARSLDRPLTIGQLLYAKLRLALPPEFEVEVLWNHFRDLLIIVINKGDFEWSATLPNMQMARPDLVQHINQLTDLIKEAMTSPE